MAITQDYGKIFKHVISALGNEKKTKKEIIDAVISKYGLTSDELKDNSIQGKYYNLTSRIGTVIADVEKKGIIAKDEDGLYRKIENDLIMIRVEQCEEEILNLVRGGEKTRSEIRDSLVNFFGTDTTISQKDDNRLFTHIGRVLKKMTRDGIFEFDGRKYTISPEREASISDHAEVLKLKREFLVKLHSKGGEFFEYYFLNLLTKYLTRTGKNVTEGYVTGGADDGGIDGIVKTVDSLGFRELIMVQMKNRLDDTKETDIRAFYGAVCARQGSRGIFATTADFHPMATKLLDSIDNCVGINGDKIFSMACDASYGIKRKDSKLIIDSEII